MKILLVDDDKKGRPFMREAIEKLGHIVSGEAEDGIQALSMYEKQQPDLVFMDIDIPVMDGFDVIKLIREVDREAKIIVISGTDWAPEMVRGAGALGALKKPLRVEKIRQLLEQVAAALQKKSGKRRRHLTEYIP